MTNPYLLQIAQKLARNMQGNQATGPLVYARKIDDIVRGETYPLTLQTMREKLQGKNNQVQHMFAGEDGRSVVRPLTCKESFEALVEHYNSGSDPEQKLQFWRNGFDTCTGIIVKESNPAYVKIISLSRELVNIPLSFTGKYIDIDYSKFEVEEFPFRREYCVPLKKEDVPNNLYWLAAFDNNKPLLKEVANIVFSETRKEKAMEFGLGPNAVQCKVLKAIYINGIDNDMRANAESPLDVPCRFLTLKGE